MRRVSTPLSTRRPKPFVVAALAVWLAEGVSRGADPLRLPSPTYPAVVALLDHGQPAEALAQLETTLAAGKPAEPPVEAAVLQAHLLEQTGRGVEAEPVWRVVRARAPVLEDFATRRLVKSLARRDAPAEAERELAALVRRRGARETVGLLLDIADAYRRTGDAATAIALYRQALAAASDGPLADRTRLSLAATLEAAGDLSAALGTYRDAALAHWSLEAYDAARDGERRLAARGARAEAWTEAQFETLVERLRARSHFAAARAVLEEWQARYPATPKADTVEALLVETLYDERANDEALRRAERFGQRFAASPLVPRVRLTELRLHAREGRTRQLRAVAAELRGAGATRRPEVPPSISWQAGVLLAAFFTGAGAHQEALALYQALGEEAPDAAARRSMRWRSAVVALAAGESTRARRDLEALATERTGDDLARAARYWLAVLDKRQGRDEVARRGWQALIAERPNDYYGLLAARRLARDGSTEPVVLPPLLSRSDRTAPIPAVLAGPTSRHPQYQAAALLARAGLRAEAAATLRQLLLQDGKSDRALALLAARAAAEAGDHRQALGLVATYFPPERMPAGIAFPEDLWTLAYPRPFWREVRDAASARRVDPLLLLAIMRQESRFDPTARSAVGALGLFQIMPATARMLSGEADDALGGRDGAPSAPLDEATMLRPSVNAALAATLLARLTARFAGALAPTVAAYNAGEDRVRAWWAAWGGHEDDLFVETIPYSETRLFVKEVLTNYWTYQRLYAPTR